MDKYGLLTLLFIAGLLAVGSAAAANESAAELHVFYGQGCPHCAKAQAYLQDAQVDYPLLRVHTHEVYQSQEGRELFERFVAHYGTTIQGVPTIFIGERVIVGFSNDLAKTIDVAILECIESGCTTYDGGEGARPTELKETVGESSPSTEEEGLQNRKLTIPLVIGAAAVDAINPCAFAVLIILMGAALAIADKKKALRFGLAFTVSIYISYFLIGLGLFSVIQAAGISHTFYIVVTILAVIVGLLNVKDYFWYGKGFLMEVPLSWRPTLKRILSSATSPLGAFLIGFVVSLFELPCTGGPYIVILGLLASQVTMKTGVAYLLLYNLVFVLPLLILSFVIYKGLSTTEQLESIRQKKLRTLHLIAGILMLAIAAAMVLSLAKGWV